MTDDGTEVTDDGTEVTDDGTQDGGPLADLHDELSDDLPVAAEDEEETRLDVAPEPTDERGESSRDRTGPLGDMADELEERRRRVGDADADDLFESVPVEEIDSDELWEQIERDGPTMDASAATEEVRTIKKSKYCQRCEYFTEPPAVGCRHEGTTIDHEVDIDHFEVIDCPKVLEDERLENV